MVSALILTHGGLARELLASAETIAGRLPAFRALCLEWNEGPDQAAGKISDALAELDEGDGVIILTDMYGGTPNNVAQRFQQPDHVEVVSGVNLPMVLRLGCRSGGGCESMPVGELARWLEAKGRQSVRRVSDGTGRGGAGNAG